MQVLSFESHLKYLNLTFFQKNHCLEISRLQSEVKSLYCILMIVNRIFGSHKIGFVLKKKILSPKKEYHVLEGFIMHVISKRFEKNVMV